nr:hypothetical protein Iba_scaffold8941CG0020 [Ipomoea batatas]
MWEKAPPQDADVILWGESSREQTHSNDYMDPDTQWDEDYLIYLMIYRDNQNFEGLRRYTEGQDRPWKNQRHGEETDHQQQPPLRKDDYQEPHCNEHLKKAPPPQRKTPYYDPGYYHTL